AGLTELRLLDLQSNKLTSVSPLSSCAALEDLNISANSLTDISPLKSLNKLLYLNFSNNQVATIPGFSKKCGLVTINGNSNNISSLAPLSGLQNLNKVYMDYNTEIKTVKDLASCPRLVEVNVYATKVTSVNVLTDQSIIVNYNPVQ
ncbi:MAG: leucine-rich repeat domain-containing protein, partial [Oscillospiraceae bacterium]|nr:leucine-rich repeat domain-containing protein [Oscillospiraceae bacterium]